MQNVLVTGGAGFIGSHLVDMLLEQGKHVVVLDLLTYAGSMENLAEARVYNTFEFVHGDICDGELVSNILRNHNIDTVFHLAAESHVDNSIADPGKFIQTNVTGTYSMLYACLHYWEDKGRPHDFRFIHVSTDEVFGQLGLDDPAFNEQTAYAPNSPYSASKAASDLLARAWYHTYKFPAIITNCSNNFGTRQHTEKLIPKVVALALSGKPITIYGSGENIRDWLYVKDHCQGLILAATHGNIGESYCFGGNNEIKNIDIVLTICDMLDTFKPKGSPYRANIIHVADRKGHDFRYAIDATKARTALNWQTGINFAENLYTTIRYYGVMITPVKPQENVQ
ncbi:MAG TPA: dTDP-glucose 4,6-dehydratase [Gammaproteobacteria bacterium]|nr:dTDP-glucose 4,6-dehydratase [Gammaproteobacteria bacterium]